VHHHAAALHRLAQRGGIEDVAMDHAQARVPEEPAVLHGVAVAVVEDDDVVRLQQTAREGRADEAAAPREEDARARDHDGPKRITQLR
jgi:hypothetical protein